MTSTRIMILNCILFVGIVGIAVAILNQENALPGPPPVEELRDAVDNRLENEELTGDAQGAELARLGSVNLFDTIIPSPTPAPTPTPAPPEPPDINEVIKDWELKGVLRNVVVFHNRRTREDWNMRIGDTKTERFRNRDIQIELEAIVAQGMTRTATLKMVDLGKTQRKTLSVF
jgi:hypothetical protein